jgi:hypothetical protein
MEWPILGLEWVGNFLHETILRDCFQDERNEFALLFRHSVYGVLPLTVHGCSSLVKTPIFSHG